MENRKSIITQLGTKQYVIKDRETYPNNLCNYIEDIISCSTDVLSKFDGGCRIRFIKGGTASLQLKVDGCFSELSKSNSSVVLIRLNKSSLRSVVYFGDECDITFNTEEKTYNLDTVDNCVETLKNFYSSWVARRGNIGVVMFIIDNYSIFSKLVSDIFFKDSYIICSD